MDKKVIAAVICAVVIGAALGAFFLAKPAPQIEQKQSEITVTDSVGRTVTIKKPVERVVLTRVRYMINEFAAIERSRDPFKKIAGWGPDLKNYDRDTYDKYKEKFPEIEDIPDVGDIFKGTFSAEKVITLKPDVVIMTIWEAEKAKAKDDISKLEQAGIPVVIIDYRTGTLETHTESTLLLGMVLGKEERAQEIMDFYEEQVNIVYSRLEKIDKPKPKVYIEGGSKGPSEYGGTYGKGVWNAIIESCGGINIAEGLPTGPINPEYLLDANPDVIFITGQRWATPGSMRLGYYASAEESREILKAFTERPGWDTLNATKNHRVYSIHHGLAWHIYDFVSVQYFAKCFYPDEFEDLDPEESFKEFHERFLPVDYDYGGVWMISLEE